jgi:hypothetical protein
MTRQIRHLYNVLLQEHEERKIEQKNKKETGGGAAISVAQS